MEIIILIGAARSGTKFLRALFAASPMVGAVPYDVNYIWRYDNETHPDDVLPAVFARTEVKTYIRRMLFKQGGVGGAKSILVEKTVSNSLRVPFVSEVFPEARFIHLIRDGRNVIESALRMWQERPDWHYLVQKARTFPLSNYRYAAWYLSNLASGVVRGKHGTRVWGPRYSGIDVDVAEKTLIEVCARQWVASVKSASSELANLSANRVMTIHYEALINSEVAVIDLARFAGIAAPEPILAVYRETVSRDTGGGWSRLTEVDRRMVSGIVSPQLQELGYDHDHAGVLKNKS